jgi:hypothetical protein
MPRGRESDVVSLCARLIAPTHRVFSLENRLNTLCQLLFTSISNDKYAIMRKRLPTLLFFFYIFIGASDFQAGKLHFYCRCI